MIQIIAKRYAKALMELAHEKNTVDRTKADLAAFASAVAEQATLQRLFASPAFTPEAKKGVIGDLAGKLGLQKTTTRFIEYLAETGRIRYVRAVQESFEDLLAERQNRAKVKLTTATDLGPGELDEIKKKLAAVTGKQVEVDARVDASLIGGARAQIGSMIYDGTIKSQLAKMRENLAK